MKIAYILPSLVNKGPIVVVNNLVQHLKDKVSLIEVYYFDDIKGMHFDCPTYRISMLEPIEFDKYDIIHSHCFRPDYYVNKWKYLIKYSCLITTLHQDTFKSFCYEHNVFSASLMTLYWCFLQRRLDGIISISNQLKEKYKFLLKGEVQTIYNGVALKTEGEINKEYASLINAMKEKYKVIGTYAFITKRKGLSQVLKVLCQKKDYCFVIIGEGPALQSLKIMTKKLNIYDRVLFLPYMDNPHLFLLFFDLYIMPSYSEGFGLSMVEAALDRKAIVCSNLPSFHEIFNDEAMFFKLDNLSSLSNAIDVAYKERILRGEKAYKRAKEMFTTETMAANHLLYYQKQMTILNSKKTNVTF